MATNKTQPTDVDPHDFVAAVPHPRRRADAEVLLDLFGRVTGWSPRMWGPSLVGYGRYHYVYDSGREGDFFVTGFSPRKANLVLYVLPGFDALDDARHRLGKHRVGRSCLYVNKLDDVDLDVLEAIVREGVRLMDERWGVHPS